MLSYITSGYDAMAPSVLFSFSFLFSSCWALVFSSEWNFTPSLNTYLVITLGTLEFTVVCFIISKYNNVRNFGDIKRAWKNRRINLRANMKLKRLKFMNNLQKHPQMTEGYLEPFFSFCYHLIVNF